MKTLKMRGKILSRSVVSRPPGDPYLTISQMPTIFPILAKMVLFPRPYRSGLVVRPPAWDPRGARFDSWCMFQPGCFWGGAKVFSAAKTDLSQNKAGGPRILYFSRERRAKGSCCVRLLLGLLRRLARAPYHRFGKENL